MSKRNKIILISIVASSLCITLVAFIAIFSYLNTYYQVKDEAIEAFLYDSSIKAEKLDKDATAFIPESPRAGLIFYPGGKVEVDAYYPLMAECAENGILCVIIKMPFNLAVFNINGADGIKEKYPDIENWYLGGHSLGGSMSASYLAKNKDEYEGIVLLGSYSTANLDGENVISIYGENDGVMNKEKYEENKSNLPQDFTERVIKGGNHAGFGMYGEQKGDGESTISNKEQIELSANYIAQFILGN